MRTVGNLRNMMRLYFQKANHVPFHLQLVAPDANKIVSGKAEFVQCPCAYIGVRGGGNPPLAIYLTD